MASYTVGDYNAKLKGRFVTWDEQPSVLDVMDFLSDNQGDYEGFSVDIIVDKIHISQTNTPFCGHLEISVMLRKLFTNGLPWVLEVESLPPQNG